MDHHDQQIYLYHTENKPVRYVVPQHERAMR
jgi:hypothetical protein